MSKFFQKLDQTKVCLGLDPRFSFDESYVTKNNFITPIPKEISKQALGTLESCWDLLEKTLHDVSAVKINSAFFEAQGSEGYLVMELLTKAIQQHEACVPVIIDAKRSDIASSSQAYAQAVFKVIGADAITVNPLMGIDSIAPFFEEANDDKGVFVLCKTSNSGAEDFLTKEFGSATLYETIARKCTEEFGADRCGFVVGATASANEFRRIRAVAPHNWLLCPGLGAQGGDAKQCILAGGPNLLFPISRAIASASDPLAVCRKYNGIFKESFVF